MSTVIDINWAGAFTIVGVAWAVAYAIVNAIRVL